MQSPTLEHSADENNAESLRRKNITAKKRHEKNIFLKSLAVYKKFIETLKNLGKHVSCPHPHSCFHYTLTVCTYMKITINILKNFGKYINSNYNYLQGGTKLFGYGFGTQLLLNIIFQFKKLRAKPQLIKSVIFKKGNFNLAVFLGGFVGLYRVHKLFCFTLKCLT